MRLLAFFKREAVLTVAALCALATMVLVPPDAAYLGYIDLRVLCLLLCLMAVVAGFQSCGAFQWLAGHLLSRGTGPRALAVILVLLPFFCSMAVTNDVALITFAPFALLLLDQMDCRAAAVPLLVLQTIAANLGSMAHAGGQSPEPLPLRGLWTLCRGFFPGGAAPGGDQSGLPDRGGLAGPAQGSPIPPVHPQPLRQPGKLALYGALFLLCLLTVFRILPYGLLTVLVLGTLAAVEPALLRKLDVSLLCTFICFFVVSGNLGRLPAVHGFLQSLLERSTLLTGVLTSQIISNVPAAVLLSGFTDNWRELLLGVDIGGLGTPVASLASLITLKLYLRSPGARPARYLAVFTAWQCSAAGGAAGGGLAHVGGGVISDINRRHGQTLPGLCFYTLSQQLLPLPPVGEYLLQQRVEIRPVVFHLDVAQLMDHHQVHGRIRTVHEKTGEAQAVLSAAAAVAGAGGGDPDASREQAHFLTVIGDFRRQDLPCLFLQGADLRLGGGGGGQGSPAALLFQVPGDPAGVTGHKVVDAGLGQAAGGPHHHAAVPCDLQGQGLPARADEFIRFHAVTVAHPAEKRKRGGRDRIRIKRLKEE